MTTNARFLAFLSVLAMASVTNVSGEDSAGETTSRLTSAKQFAEEHENQVAQLMAEHEEKLAALDAQFHSELKKLRGSHLEDLKDLQDDAATKDLDEAVEIRDMARRYSRAKPHSPAEKRVAVFVYGNVWAQAIYILSADGRSMIIEPSSQEIAVGTWHADGDLLRFETKAHPRRVAPVDYDLDTIVLERNGRAFHFPHAKNAEAAGDGMPDLTRGALLMGDAGFLIQRDGNDSGEIGAGKPD